jgi:hypothetical protein
MAIWYILFAFANLVEIWYNFSRFGISWQKNLATLHQSIFFKLAAFTKEPS